MNVWRHETLQRRWLVMALALLLDHTLGDLPNRWHPVAWMGSAISAARRHTPTSGANAQLLYGAAVTGSGALIVAWLAQSLTRLCHRLPQHLGWRPLGWRPLGWLPLGWLLEAAMLKQTVALQGLARAASAVHTPLATGNETEARRQLSWHLVSRDTTTLDAPRIAAATIESVAENSSDGVIAPLLAYALLGLPGAFAYRWLNTIDSLWGYRDPAREWLGKAGARADDIANWLPARLTAFLLVAASFWYGQPGQAWRIWRRDARHTASPNAGHPMSAMAGALGVELEKTGHYQLGAGLPLPKAADILRAVTLMRAAVVTGMALSIVILWFKR